MSKRYKTSIGGQAVMEGVMMKGPRKTAMAVRKPDGSVYREVWNNPPRKAYNKIPLVRGVVNFVLQLKDGFRCLMKSADISGEGLEEPESKFEQWLARRFGDKLTQVVSVFSAVLGVLLAVGLFFFLPSLLCGLLRNFIPRWGLSLIEGLIKIGIFVAYLGLTSLMSEMKRLYQYHGAEHKTIACYEAGEELTVENIRKYPRFHPRCGTSFLLIVLVLGIIVFSVVTWSNPLIRSLLKIALLPLVVGIAYEMIKLAGRYDNLLTRMISFPGLKLQHLTTREPDDEMLEIAIQSMLPVLPEQEGEDQW